MMKTQVENIIVLLGRHQKEAQAVWNKFGFSNPYN